MADGFLLDNTCKIVDFVDFESVDFDSRFLICEAFAVGQSTSAHHNCSPD
jgi:hypothetical protein